MTREARHCSLAASGFDVVSYHTGEKPVRGNGNHVASHDGATYVFASDTNKRAFEADPDRYVPAFGGYCAFGMSIGKQLIADPDVWEIVEGRLYLNKDMEIHALWQGHRDENIRKAGVEWRRLGSADTD